MSPRPPLLFVSHKHGDRAIADVVRKFVDRWSLRDVQVFQSSSPEAAGPQLGRTLSTELKKALWDTNLLILIYTSEDQDWSWCMWECGVATNSASPDTRTIVIQCSTTEPKVFADQVRCNARSKEDVEKLVRDFLTSPQFFPGFDRAVARNFSPDGPEVREAAEELFNSLQEVLPKENIPARMTFPNLRLELSEDDLRTHREATSTPGPLSTLAGYARIVDLDPRVQHIFGIGELAPKTTLSALAARWKGFRPRAPADWLDDICGQILRGADGEIPLLNWNYVVEVNGDRNFVPILSRVRPIPTSRQVQFDVQLIPFDQLAATPVTSRMIPRSDMQVVSFSTSDADPVLLIDVAATFDSKRLSRIPFVDRTGVVRYIVHRSMIDRYLVSMVTKGKDIKSATFSHLLDDAPELKAMFSASFATVDHEARMSEAQSLMSQTADCQDVFVTEKGTRDEPPIGWITNVIVAQSRSAVG